MINNVVLVGRLTKDPDLRYTPGGNAVATFTLASNRNFTNNQTGKRETDFINCVIWRKPAETMATYARKGTLLGVVGRIQTRHYENQQGQRVYVTEVVCENFQLLESRSASEQRQNGSEYQPNTSDSGGNFQSQNDSKQSASQTNNNGMPDLDRDSDPFKGSRAVIDISDDDLPF